MGGGSWVFSGEGGGSCCGVGWVGGLWCGGSTLSVKFIILLINIMRKACVEVHFFVAITPEAEPFPLGWGCAFDWGTPEQPSRHPPEEVAVLRARKRSARKANVTRCRACLGPTDARKRCANRVNPKAGVEPGAPHHNDHISVLSG